MAAGAGAGTGAFSVVAGAGTLFVGAGALVGTGTVSRVVAMPVGEAEGRLGTVVAPGLLG